MYRSYETDQHSIWCLQLTFTGVYSLQGMPETSDGMIMRKAMMHLHQAIADYQAVTVLEIYYLCAILRYLLNKDLSGKLLLSLKTGLHYPEPSTLIRLFPSTMCSLNVPITASNPMSRSSPGFLKAEMSGILLYDVVTSISELGEHTIQCSL